MLHLAKGSFKTFHCLVIITCGEGFHSHMPAVSGITQGFGDQRIVDFSGARFMPTGNICDMYVAQIVCCLTDEFDHISFFNLGVIDIQQQPDAGAAHLLN